MSSEIDDFVAFLRKYIGKTVNELCDIFDVHTHAKNKNSILISKIYLKYQNEHNLTGLEGTLNDVAIKTIQLKENGNPEEGMSFRKIDYLELAREEWITSSFRNYLANSVFVFVIFQRSGEGDENNVLINIFRWQVPLEDLDGGIKFVWEDTKKKLLSGNLIRDFSNGKIKTTFMRESQTQVCHVRPHGRTGGDLSPIPVPDTRYGFTELPKHSFWFNHSYIIKILSGETAKTGKIGN